MIPPARIHVRFSDLDVLGHVNNSIYLSYFEMTRVHYFAHLLGKNWDWQKDGVVLVKNEVEYLKPVLLHDNPEVTMVTEHLGNKSFTLSYQLMVGDVIHSKGNSTLVCFDSSIGKTVEIPEKMREGLARLKREQ